MSETAVKVEKESGVVRRVADRIGKFLSETYTVKGAKQKEIGKYAGLYSQFTPSQQEEMKAFYEKKVGKTATWKVIRNWVATGAGLALGYGLMQPGNAALMWKFVTDTAPKAIASGADKIFHWMFHVYNVNIVPGAVDLMSSGGTNITKTFGSIQASPLNWPWLGSLKIGK